MITQDTTILYDTQWRNTVLQEQYLEVDTTNQAITITLPEIVSMGGFFNVKFYITDTNGNSATNNITIATQGSDLIDSGSSITISTNYGSVLIACNGTSWIALESSNIAPPTPPQIALLADGVIDMGVSDPQQLTTYYTKSIVTDVVLAFVDGAVVNTAQGALLDYDTTSLIAKIIFNNLTESGIKVDGNYIDKDIRYTSGALAVAIEGIVPQSFRGNPFYFQSSGLDSGVSVQVYVYGYNYDK